MSVGIWQVVLILLVVLIIFGAGKLPKVMGDLGKGMRSFKKGMSDDMDYEEGEPESAKVIEEEKGLSKKTSATGTKKKMATKKASTSKKTTATKKSSSPKKTVKKASATTAKAKTSKKTATKKAAPKKATTKSSASKAPSKT